MISMPMTEGAPWKHIVRFALPVLLGSLLQQLYNTVDAIVVGNFAGEASLSAVGTTGSFAFLFLAIAMGFSAGNGVVVAQHYGAKDEVQVRQNASTGILFLMALGVIFGLLGFIVARPAFTHIVNVPDSYLGLTLQYFRIYALGLVFQYGYNIFSSILRAVGDSAATLYFLLIASVLNILLDLLFVAVFHWGVAGAAIATVIAQAASFVAAYIYMTRKYPVFRFRLSDYHWNRYIIRRTVSIGFPISLQLMIVSIHRTDAHPARGQRLRTGNDRFLHRRQSHRDVSESSLQCFSDDNGDLCRPKHWRRKDGPYKNGRMANDHDFAWADADHFRHRMDMR